MARRILLAVSAFVVASLALAGCSSSPVSDQPLIRLGSQGVASESDKSASDALWYATDYSYVPGPGLALEGESAHIYKLSPKGDPMTVAASIAKVFGVLGAVEKIEESPSAPMPVPAADGATVTLEPAEGLIMDSFVYYQVGSKDWTGPSLQLYWSNTGSWYYNNPAAYGPPQLSCASPETEAGSPIAKDCFQEPIAPRNLPSAADARAQAVKIFTATGLTVSPSDVRVQADDWGVFATASLKVEGQPVGIEWNISWGDQGIISSAAGHAVSVTDMGSFDSISDRAAVARVGDWRWYGGAATSWYPDMFGSRVPMNDDLVSVDEAQSAISTSPATGVANEGAAGNKEEAIEESTSSPEPSFTPRKVTVVLVKSARALLTVVDKSGGIWLVPGYVFFDVDGGVYPVMSVVPGVVELPESTEIMLR